MFSLPLRPTPGAHAIGVERVAGTVAIGAAEAFWLAQIAALFVAWAMSPSANQTRGLTAFRGKALLPADQIEWRTSYRLGNKQMARRLSH